MNADIQALLEKQAAWQRSRAARPWAEKLRASVAMRTAVRSLRRHPSLPRRTGPPPATTTSSSHGINTFS